MHWVHILCASVFIGLAHPVIVCGEGDAQKSDDLTKRQLEDDEASQEEKDRELNESVDGKSHYDDVADDPELAQEELEAKIGQARNGFARIPSASSIGWDIFPPLPNIGPPQTPGMKPPTPGQTSSSCCGSKPKPPNNANNGWQPPNNGWQPPQPPNNNGWPPPQQPNNNGWRPPNNGWQPPNNGLQNPTNGWRPPQPPSNNGWLPPQPPNNNGWLPPQQPNNNGWRPPNNGWLPSNNPPPPYQPPYQPPSGFPPGYPSLYPSPPSNYYPPSQPQGPGNNYQPSFPQIPFYPPPDFQGNFGFPPPDFGFYPPNNPFGPLFNRPPLNPNSRSISTSPLYPNPPFNNDGGIINNIFPPFRRQGGWDDTSDDHSDLSKSKANLSWLQTIFGQKRLKKSTRTQKMDTHLFPSEKSLKQTKITKVN